LIFALFLAAGCTRGVGAESWETAGDAAPAAETPLDRTGWPDRIVWGFVPYLPENVIRTEFGRIARALGDRLEVPFDIVVTRDYEELRRRVQGGSVDFAQLAPLNYVRAKEEMPGLQIVVTHVADGSPTYQGYLLVRDDSPIRRVVDLRGRRMCWVDRDSTSGYLYPRALLRKRGIDPDRFFVDPPIFTGNHSAAVDALLAGGCDVAAVYSGALKEGWGRGVARGALRILVKTQRIPYDAYCLRPGLPPSLTVAIRRALFGISTRTGEGRAILGHVTRINGFMIAFDEQYDGVRAVERGEARADLPAR
jgi:phosphate/phosphite/phosphonate ABC transporter binding protein